MSTTEIRRKNVHFVRNMFGDNYLFKLPVLHVGENKMLYLEVFRVFINPTLNVYSDVFPIFKHFPLNPTQIVLRSKVRNDPSASIDSISLSSFTLYELFTIFYLNALQLQFYTIVAFAARILGHNCTAAMCIESASMITSCLYNVVTQMTTLDTFHNRVFSSIPSQETLLCALSHINYDPNTRQLISICPEADHGRPQHKCLMRDGKRICECGCMNSYCCVQYTQLPISKEAKPIFGHFLQTACMNLSVLNTSTPTPQQLIEAAFQLEFVRGVYLLLEFSDHSPNRRKQEFLGILNTLCRSATFEQTFVSSISPFHAILEHPSNPLDRHADSTGTTPFHRIGQALQQSVPLISTADMDRLHSDPEREKAVYSQIQPSPFTINKLNPLPPISTDPLPPLEQKPEPEKEEPVTVPFHFQVNIQAGNTGQTTKAVHSPLQETKLLSTVPPFSFLSVIVKFLTENNKHPEDVPKLDNSVHILNQYPGTNLPPPNKLSSSQHTLVSFTSFVNTLSCKICQTDEYATVHPFFEHNHHLNTTNFSASKRQHLFERHCFPHILDTLFFAAESGRHQDAVEAALNMDMKTYSSRLNAARRAHQRALIEEEKKGQTELDGFCPFDAGIPSVTYPNFISTTKEQAEHLYSISLHPHLGVSHRLLAGMRSLIASLMSLLPPSFCLTNPFFHNITSSFSFSDVHLNKNALSAMIQKIHQFEETLVSLGCTRRGVVMYSDVAHGAVVSLVASSANAVPSTKPDMLQFLNQLPQPPAASICLSLFDDWKITVPKLYESEEKAQEAMQKDEECEIFHCPCGADIDDPTVDSSLLITPQHPFIVPSSTDRARIPYTLNYTHPSISHHKKPSHCTANSPHINIQTFVNEFWESPYADETALVDSILKLSRSPSDDESLILAAATTAAESITHNSPLSRDFSPFVHHMHLPHAVENTLPTFNSKYTHCSSDNANRAFPEALLILSSFSAFVLTAAEQWNEALVYAIESVRISTFLFGQFHSFGFRDSHFSHRIMFLPCLIFLRILQTPVDATASDASSETSDTQTTSPLPPKAGPSLLSSIPLALLRQSFGSFFVLVQILRFFTAGHSHLNRLYLHCLQFFVTLMLQNSPLRTNKRRPHHIPLSNTDHSLTQPEQSSSTPQPSSKQKPNTWAGPNELFKVAIEETMQIREESKTPDEKASQICVRDAETGVVCCTTKDENDWQCYALPHPDTSTLPSYLTVPFLKAVRFYLLHSSHLSVKEHSFVFEILSPTVQTVEESAIPATLHKRVKKASHKARNTLTINAVQFNPTSQQKEEEGDADSCCGDPLREEYDNDMQCYCFHQPSIRIEEKELESQVRKAAEERRSKWKETRRQKKEANGDSDSYEDNTMKPIMKQKRPRPTPSAKNETQAKTTVLEQQDVKPLPPFPNLQPLHRPVSSLTPLPTKSFLPPQLSLPPAGPPRVTLPNFLQFNSPSPFPLLAPLPNLSMSALPPPIPRQPVLPPPTSLSPIAHSMDFPQFEPAPQTLPFVSPQMPYSDYFPGPPSPSQFLFSEPKESELDSLFFQPLSFQDRAHDSYGIDSGDLSPFNTALSPQPEWKEWISSEFFPDF
ncbi:hypothetical protein BLNAU_7967 [Blattamonas nauphoetae]|uniref:Uncharacterized protein n=1 Tax=Blattamonas nauphoetae TaxID=2049346 RepID=A0ABQ9Y068_9EUKA|nr:hypothetical protein BLNAU_7967 [Blattamonas nauphoetae]